MDQKTEQEYRESLKKGIKKSYANLVKKVDLHHKQWFTLDQTDRNIKTMQVILSGLTTGSLLYTFIVDQQILSYVIGVISLGILILSSISVRRNFAVDAAKHLEAAATLHGIKEVYGTVLMDLPILATETIRLRRDELIQQTTLAEQQFVKVSYFSEIDKSVTKENRGTGSLEPKDEIDLSEQEIEALLPEKLRG